MSAYLYADLEVAPVSEKVTVAEPTGSVHLPPTVQPVRVVVWLFHVALPMVGLWLLLARPSLDVMWHDPHSHFWLILVVAGISTLLGCWVSVEARRRADARLALVSMAFLASASFFAVHGLATPGVLLERSSNGFELAQPAGLTLAALFAAASALPLEGERAAAVLRNQVPLWLALAGLCVVWTALSLLNAPPLNHPAGERQVIYVMAVPAVAGLVFATVRYYQLHRRRRSAVLLSIITAFVLLTEVVVALVLAPSWHLSWWEWHLLLVFAFGFVAYSTWVQYRREGSTAGLFDAVALAETARRIRAEYGAALEELVSVLRRRAEGTADETAQLTVAARLAERFDLTEGQQAVLARAGGALARERDVSDRLAALVAVGEQARVGLAEEDLLERIHRRVRDAYGPVTIALADDGAVRVGERRYDPAALGAGTPVREAGVIAYPLTVRGHVAGVLEVPETHGDYPELLAALANQLSTALENARLYQELEGLFRAYLSPDVAAALLADPSQADLGGSLVEVTALFADLRGFTTFSEAVEPAEIVRMLNRYHGVAVPCVLDHGGTVIQFVGDALLAVWGAPARQEDHAARAVRAALAMQRAVDEIAAAHPDWPRFRIGANTGPALVGNIGSESLRGFNAMGDAVNVAARLQGLAEPGQVVIGEATRAAIGDGLAVRPLGDLRVKGRQQPVRAYVVTGSPDGAG